MCYQLSQRLRGSGTKYKKKEENGPDIHYLTLIKVDVDKPSTVYSGLSRRQ